MNLSTALIMPWRASPRSSNMFAVAIAALVLIAAIGIGCYAQTCAVWMIVIIVLALGNLFLWVSWLGGMLLLALHADRLRLPGVQRSVVAALALYAVLTVVLPAVIVGGVGFGVANTLCILGLAAAAGVLVAIMPIYAYFVLLFGALALQASPLVVAMPSPGDRLFVPCALLAMAGLTLAAIGRWSQLLRHPEVRQSSWRKPIVMQLRTDTRCRSGMFTNAGKGNPSGADLNTLIRQRPDWLQPRVNLTHVDPQHPVAALRVGIGGMCMPVTGRTRFVRLGLLLLLAMGLFVGVALSDADHGSIDTLWRSVFWRGGLRALVLFATFYAVVVALSSTVYMQRYWRQRLDDLALLALLPGMGRTDRVIPDVLRASLMVPLRAQAALLVVSLAAALASGAGVGDYLLILAPQLAAIVYVVAASVATIGGVSIVGSDVDSFVRRSCMVALATIAGLLFAATLILQTIGKSQMTDMRMMVLCACWAAVCVVLFWVGRQGWQALQQRPHAFLRN